VRYDQSLPAGAKLLYGDLTALTNKKGYCFASNGYMADLLQVTEITISNWISKLKKAGHVKIGYNPHRRIYVKSYSKSK
jgi:Mn-dependent DtxR family transcriptional regulator